MNQLAMTLGGRAAEEIVFNEVTTGAANDLEKVTHTAKQMIMRFGMSEKLGPRVLGRNHDMPFLGREMGAEPDYSEEIAREIDDEIRRVIEEAHMTATRSSRSTSTSCTRLSLILIERETIDKDQFERLLAGEAEESVFADEAPARQAGARARGREEAQARAEDAAVPDPGSDHAASAARRRQGLVPEPGTPMGYHGSHEPDSQLHRFGHALRPLRAGGQGRGLDRCRRE